MSFGNDAAFKEEHTEVFENEEETFEMNTYMPTLPSTFKSLVGKTVKIETEEPRCIIQLLGDLLGITDYMTNKAAFWFLDIIALQILRYKNDLDDYYRGVLISWLVGEMKLIQDKKLSREDFFKQMKVLFLRVADELSAGDELLHWELFKDKYFEIISQHPTVNKPAISGTSVTNNTQEQSLINFKSALTADDLQIDVFTDVNIIAESSRLTNPNIALDRIIDATYNMYANELRYALVYAVFVMPIQMPTFRMPHTLRVPRQIKFADSGEGPFDMQLHKQLEKIAIELTISDPINKEQKEKIKKRQTILTTPPVSLIEEEELAVNRQFILPLIEAKEAAQIFQMHAENT